MKPIGVYTISNNASILVYDIEYGIEDKVLISLNDDEKEWVNIESILNEDTNEYELGFYWGEFPIYFNEVLMISTNN